MRVIVNRYKKLQEEKRQFYKIITCDYCDSEFEIDKTDTYIGALGCRYVKCPCCSKGVLLDGEGIKLTKDNLHFPTHYFSYKNCVELSDENVDEYVRRCIEAFRESNDDNFYAMNCGSGDTSIFVFRNEETKEYNIYVGKGGYETYVNFEDADN